MLRLCNRCMLKTSWLYSITVIIPSCQGSDKRSAHARSRRSRSLTSARRCVSWARRLPSTAWGKPAAARQRNTHHRPARTTRFKIANYLHPPASMYIMGLADMCAVVIGLWGLGNRNDRPIAIATQRWWMTRHGQNQWSRLLLLPWHPHVFW